MVFSSTVFLFLFLPFTIIGYYNPWFKGRKFRNYFLLFMSMVFYAYGEPLFVGIMILEIVIGWLLGKKIELMQQQKNKKRWLYVGVFFFVAMLFVFKYLTFFNTQFTIFLVLVYQILI